MRPWIPLTALALAFSPLLVVHPVRVSGRSMEPALHDGDLRWSLRAWASHAPQRGEIWVVDGPGGASIKRVIGLPGETVVWRGPDVWINGQRLDEPWVIHPERNGEGQQDCSLGYLLLGDNRPESQDGRSWGPRSVQALRGRVL
jgi:signal peptidase I